MTDPQSSYSIFLALLPLIAGGLGSVVEKSNLKIKAACSATILVLGASLVFLVDMDPAIRFLAFAVLFSGYCVLHCQDEAETATDILPSCMVVMGLALGALLGQGFGNRLFLCGLLGYAAFSLAREKNRNVRTTLVLIHLIVAIILSLSSAMGGGNLQKLAGLFLAVTFLPLAPFHLPFVSTIDKAKGPLASFWITAWLAVGLAELNALHATLSPETLQVLGWLALASVIYSTLAALGQKRHHLFIAAAIVAHVSMVWGLLDVFPDFPRWGIAYGVTVALLMGGISLTFSFVQKRYGWKTIGKLPGLATPMPRFGTHVVLLVSSTLFLPMVPALSGFAVMPADAALGFEFLRVVFILLAVWLGGGWYLIQMVHQTAFGEARRDVPYTDLVRREVTAVSALLIGAGYSGLLY